MHWAKGCKEHFRGYSIIELLQILQYTTVPFWILGNAPLPIAIAMNLSSSVLSSSTAVNIRFLLQVSTVVSTSSEHNQETIPSLDMLHNYGAQAPALPMPRVLSDMYQMRPWRLAFFRLWGKHPYIIWQAGKTIQHLVHTIINGHSKW